MNTFVQFAIIAIFAALPLLADNPLTRTPLPQLASSASKIQKEQQSAAPDREPGFEETKRFILKYTRTEWWESEGDHHRYSLTITNRHLLVVHTFNSDYVPSYVERIEVDLSSLDPSRIDRVDLTTSFLSLATTGSERKISVQVTMQPPISGVADRKYQEDSMTVPGSDKESQAEQLALDNRLKKAWAHLITLAGGKPGADEPF